MYGYVNRSVFIQKPKFQVSTCVVSKLWYKTYMSSFFFCNRLFCNITFNKLQLRFHLITKRLKGKCYKANHTLIVSRAEEYLKTEKTLWLVTAYNKSMLKHLPDENCFIYKQDQVLWHIASNIKHHARQWSYARTVVSSMDSAKTGLPSNLIYVWVIGKFSFRANVKKA